MGVTVDQLYYLCAFLRNGMELGRVLTLGHQTLFASVEQQREALGDYGLWEGEGSASRAPYVDELLLKLGARAVDSVDHSAFEKASLIHDMNAPVPERLHEQYDTVYDGGTIEHIYDTRTAIANCLRMLRPGGHLLLTMPANNCMGHGLYQFSPDFIYAVFGRNPSARVLDVLIAEVAGRRRWYKVKPFEEVGARTNIVNKTPLYLYAVIQKAAGYREADVQQSDYVASWEDREVGGKQVSAARRLARKVHQALPGALRRRLVALYQKHYVYTLRNGAAFMKVSKRNYVLRR